MSHSRSIVATLVLLGFPAGLVAAPPVAVGEESRVGQATAVCQLTPNHWRSLDWGDPLVQKHVKSLGESEKRRLDAARESNDKKVRDRALRRIQMRILLSSQRQGGALTHMAEQGTPWLLSSPQVITSLGRIAWYGNLAEARKVADKTGRPLLIVSTELPGCGACVGHGQNQLSHPLVVDAALEFVPVVVSGGWPKLIFQDTKGRELGPRATHETSVAETLKRMHAALRAAKRPIPDWLELVVGEQNAAQRETATFGMGCFWVGESELGKINGVLSTRVGFLKGEVVELQFDPAVVSYEKLLVRAQQFKCASKVIVRTKRQAAIAGKRLPGDRVLRLDDPIKVAEADTKYGLKQNKTYAALPLTELQAVKLNSLQRDGEKYLSPSQRLLKAKLNEFLKSGKELGELSLDYSSLKAFDNHARALRDKLMKRKPS